MSTRATDPEDDRRDLAAMMVPLGRALTVGEQPVLDVDQEETGLVSFDQHLVWTLPARLPGSAARLSRGPPEASLPNRPPSAKAATAGAGDRRGQTPAGGGRDRP